MNDHQERIEQAYLDPQPRDTALTTAVEEVLQWLGAGELRVAEPTPAGDWRIHQWLKKAILLSFRLRPTQVVEGGYTRFYDRFGLKFADWSGEDFQQAGIRVVPPAVVREAAYIASNVILMPCYVNMGAYIDRGSLIDTWATVGSCAQIGKNVHLSGGAGVGGVLEPLRTYPTIIEDDCFIGARSEIVEGVRVEQGAVISMGVFIGQSTPIYNRLTGETSYGRVPTGAVVIPGSLPSADGSYARAAAIIVKQVDAQTRAKTGLNELLRFDDTAE